MKTWLAIVTVLLMFVDGTGCSYLHKNAPPVHPGAISNLDSYSYDILLAEQAAINNARAQYMGGSLPASAKGPLNAAIDQYNVTMSAWQSYHANGQGETALQQAINSLIAAVGALEKALQKQPTSVPATAGYLLPGMGRLVWV